MEKQRIEGEVANVEFTAKGLCRIRVNSVCSGGVYEVEVEKQAFELLNYNIEKVKETGTNCNLLNSSANIYMEEYSAKFEVVFTEPILYSVAFSCRSVEKVL